MADYEPCARSKARSVAECRINATSLRYVADYKPCARSKARSVAECRLNAIFKSNDRWLKRSVLLGGGD